MSNIFKQNSRFAALADEIQEPKRDKKLQDKKLKENNINATSNENNIFKRAPEERYNSFSNDRYNSFSNDRYNSFSNNRNRNFDNKNKEHNEKRIKDEKMKREKEQEEEKQKALAPENFPDIVVNNINNANNEKKISMNFSEKLKSVKKEQELEGVDLDYANLKPGWALTKRDPLTKKLITLYKESHTSKPREKTQREIGIDIINALVELHKKRTEEYIEMWGYETWEKMYRFPNYDYEYFDKLDELYEEMENESSAESDEEEY